MSELLQQLKMASRDHLASAIFLIVVGTVALAFIGYLTVDFFRTLRLNSRIKRRHQDHGRSHTDRSAKLSA